MGIKTRFEKEAKGIRKWPIENWSYKVNTLNNHRLDQTRESGGNRA